MSIKLDFGKSSNAELEWPIEGTLKEFAEEIAKSEETDYPEGRWNDLTIERIRLDVEELEWALKENLVEQTKKACVELGKLALALYTIQGGPEE